MKKINILFGIIFFSALSIIINAQEVTGTVVATAGNTVKNAPYSADSTSENVQTLSDGNRITRLSVYKVFRDSEGRTRREQLPSSTFTAEYLNSQETITITDPVAGFNYYLNPIAKTARKIAVIAPPPVVSLSSSRLSGFSSTSETLGKKTIEGVECTGRISKTVIAPGVRGNEKELVSTSESWYSPELRIGVLFKTTDLQFGNNTIKLTNIIRTEPDKSLFTIPSDYKIITNVVNASVTNISITESKETNP